MGLIERLREKGDLNSFLKTRENVSVYFRDREGKSTELKVNPDEKITSRKIISEGRMIDGCLFIDVVGNDFKGIADGIRLREIVSRK